MTAQRSRTKVRALVGFVALGVAFTPLLVTQAAEARTRAPQFRAVSAPQVFYPVKGTPSVRDLATSTRRRTGTDIRTACDAAVFASHPGTVQVRSATSTGQRVRVISSTNGLKTSYAHLSNLQVSDGQIVQSGQALGQIVRAPRSGACTLYFAASSNGRRLNPTAWLNDWVGKTAPVADLFDTPGFTLASFNILGASHTTNSTRYATYPSRLNKAVALMESRAFDVVGAQEFQERQFDYFVSRGNADTWDSYYWNPEGKRRDTENLIMWRKSTMEFVSGSTFDIPYFGGNTRHVPIVLLREKATGRTAYFLNVHNASNVRGPAAQYRAEAIAIERQQIIDLRATGRPVFITGDFNDRQDAFCPLTADKLMISPNSIPSMDCAYPQQSSIDWIFAAGQARFSSYTRDSYSQTSGTSDHPMVFARTHLKD